MTWRLERNCKFQSKYKYQARRIKRSKGKVAFGWQLGHKHAKGCNRCSSMLTSKPNCNSCVTIYYVPMNNVITY